MKRFLFVLLLVAGIYGFYRHKTGQEINPFSKYAQREESSLPTTFTPQSAPVIKPGKCPFWSRLIWNTRV